jgi:hypothetical protein
MSKIVYTQSTSGSSETVVSGSVMIMASASAAIQHRIGIATPDYSYVALWDETDVYRAYARLYSASILVGSGWNATNEHHMSCSYSGTTLRWYLGADNSKTETVPAGLSWQVFADISLYNTGSFGPFDISGWSNVKVNNKSVDSSGSIITLYPPVHITTSGTGDPVRIHL